MPRVAARHAALVAASLAAVINTLLVAGCVKPVNTAGTLRTTPTPTAPTSQTPPAPTPSSRPRTPQATPTFAETAVVSCDGYPTADQIIALLRRTTGLLPANVTATVQQAPLCSGTWQYTVLTVPGRDPLQVVTQGPPGALQLVTAGTDVCSDVAVRAAAPPGIRAAANC